MPLNLKPTAVLLLLVIFFVIHSQKIFAQARKKQPFVEFIKAITSTDTAAYHVLYTDFIDPVPLKEILPYVKSIQLTPDSLIVVNRVVNLFDCRFQVGLTLAGFDFRNHFSIYTSVWMNREVYPDELSVFRIHDNKFSKGLSIIFEKGETPPLLDIQRNVIHREFYVNTDDAYTHIENNNIDLAAKNIIEESFSSLDENASEPLRKKRQKISFSVSANGHRLLFNKNIVTFGYNAAPDYIPSFAGYMYVNTPVAEINHNQFKTSVSNPDSLWKFDNSLQFIIQEKAKTLEFTSNSVQPDLFLQLGFNLNSLRFHNNHLTRIAFDPFKIPDESNVILWPDLRNANVGLQTGEYGTAQPFYTANEKQIEDNLAFKELLKFYKKFYDEFKMSGDIRSSNDVYIKIKDLETSELRSSHKLSPNFNLFFRVKFNQLLKHYTAYGTDPAQAIVASFWIILLFAIFYFFFPSTWDISSKSELVQNFKDFIQKNEKGYVRPFFKMSGGFALSLVNALTLSLNAFVTLGFGEIPTKGVAKYITVVEGFLGWFLLSIFTVSLVSQLLF